MTSPASIGIIGLGTMGSNLALNIAEEGFPVAGHDVDGDKVDALIAAANEQLPDGGQIQATTDPAEFLGLLQRPRAVLLLLPAGKIVDQVIEQLRPKLERDDIIIDGGNSHFTDTERRGRELARDHLRYVGMGVSGGSEGARHGPSLMPGGSRTAWEQLRPLLLAAAANAAGEPCVAWLGRGSAGHYVKMVHNGIEYGLMQLIAESYDLLKRGLGLDQQQLYDVFRNWADSDMGGYLLEITADIMLKRDDGDQDFLLDKVLDAAHQKGTGMWTSAEALERNVPTPVIDIAVGMRALSDYKHERQRASEMFAGPLAQNQTHDDNLSEILGKALSAAMILTYAQGMHLLREGSDHHDFGIPLQDVARIWRGGCIIRARLLDALADAYQHTPALRNPMFDAGLAEQLLHAQGALRHVVQTAARRGLPAPAFMAALGYYDAYRSALLPANLIQAQRDCFGAHTFERTDRKGTFHVDWVRR